MTELKKDKIKQEESSVQFRSVRLCDPMYHSSPEEEEGYEYSFRKDSREGLTEVVLG